jgi:hypothetical protein
VTIFTSPFLVLKDKAQAIKLPLLPNYTGNTGRAGYNLLFAIGEVTFNVAIDENTKCVSQGPE